MKREGHDGGPPPRAEQQEDEPAVQGLGGIGGRTSRGTLSERSASKAAPPATEESKFKEIHEIARNLRSIAQELDQVHPEGEKAAADDSAFMAALAREMDPRSSHSEGFWDGVREASAAVEREPSKELLSPSSSSQRPVADVPVVPDWQPIAEHAKSIPARPRPTLKDAVDRPDVDADEEDDASNASEDNLYQVEIMSEVEDVMDYIIDDLEDFDSMIWHDTVIELLDKLKAKDEWETMTQLRKRFIMSDPRRHEDMERLQALNVKRMMEGDNYKRDVASLAGDLEEASSKLLLQLNSFDTSLHDATDRVAEHKMRLWQEARRKSGISFEGIKEYRRPRRSSLWDDEDPWNREDQWDGQVSIKDRPVRKVVQSKAGLLLRWIASQQGEVTTQAVHSELLVKKLNLHREAWSHLENLGEQPNASSEVSDLIQQFVTAVTKKKEMEAKETQAKLLAELQEKVETEQGAQRVKLMKEVQQEIQDMKSKIRDLEEEMQELEPGGEKKNQHTGDKGRTRKKRHTSGSAADETASQSLSPKKSRAARHAEMGQKSPTRNATSTEEPQADETQRIIAARTALKAEAFECQEMIGEMEEERHAFHMSHAEAQKLAKRWSSLPSAKSGSLYGRDSSSSLVQSPAGFGLLHSEITARQRSPPDSAEVGQGSVGGQSSEAWEIAAEDLEEWDKQMALLEQKGIPAPKKQSQLDSTLNMMTQDLARKEAQAQNLREWKEKLKRNSLNSPREVGHQRRRRSSDQSSEQVKPETAAEHTAGAKEEPQSQQQGAGGARSQGSSASQGAGSAMPFGDAVALEEGAPPSSASSGGAVTARGAPSSAASSAHAAAGGGVGPTSQAAGPTSQAGGATLEVANKVKGRFAHGVKGAVAFARMSDPADLEGDGVEDDFDEDFEMPRQSSPTPPVVSFTFGGVGGVEATKYLVKRETRRRKSFADVVKKSSLLAKAMRRPPGLEVGVDGLLVIAGSKGNEAGDALLRVGGAGDQRSLGGAGDQHQMSLSAGGVGDRQRASEAQSLVDTADGQESLGVVQKILLMQAEIEELHGQTVDYEAGALTAKRKGNQDKFNADEKKLVKDLLAGDFGKTIRIKEQLKHVNSKVTVYQNRLQQLREQWREHIEEEKKETRRQKMQVLALSMVADRQQSEGGVGHSSHFNMKDLDAASPAHLTQRKQKHQEKVASAVVKFAGLLLAFKNKSKSSPEATAPGSAPRSSSGPRASILTGLGRILRNSAQSRRRPLSAEGSRLQSAESPRVARSDRPRWDSAVTVNARMLQENDSLEEVSPRQRWKAKAPLGSLLGADALAAAKRGSVAAGADTQPATPRTAGTLPMWAGRSSEGREDDDLASAPEGAFNPAFWKSNTTTFASIIQAAQLASRSQSDAQAAGTNVDLQAASSSSSKGRADSPRAMGPTRRAERKTVALPMPAMKAAAALSAVARCSRNDVSEAATARGVGSESLRRTNTRKSMGFDTLLRHINDNADEQEKPVKDPFFDTPSLEASPSPHSEALSPVSKFTMVRQALNAGSWVRRTRRSGDIPGLVIT